MLEISVDGKYLDLGENFNWEFKLENNRFDFKKIKTDFTYPSTLPGSPHNQKIFGHANKIEVGEKVWIYDCEYFANGFREGFGKLRIAEADNGNYKASIFVNGGNIEFLNSNLRDEDWGEITEDTFDLTKFDHTKQHVDGRLFAFPPATAEEIPYDFQLEHPHFNAWNFDDDVYEEASPILPFINMGEMLTQFLQKKGYQLQGNFFKSEIGKRIKFPTEVLIDQGRVGNGTVLAYHSDTTEFTYAGKNPVGNPVPVKFLDEISDINQFYNSPTGEYEIPYAGTYTVSLNDVQMVLKFNGTIFQQGEDYQASIAIYIGGEFQHASVIGGFLNYDDDLDNLYFDLNPPAYVLDKSYIGQKITVVANVIITTNVTSVDTEYRIVDGSLQISVEPAEGNEVGSSLSKVIPNRTAGYFLQELQNWYNVAVHFNANAKILYVESEVEGDYQPREHDWTQFASEKYLIKRTTDGYQINYKHKDPVPEAAVPPIIAYEVDFFFDLEGVVAPVKNQNALVKADNMIYKYNGQEWIFLELYKYPVKVGDAKNKRETEFLPIANAYYGISVVVPKVEFPLVSLFLSEDEPSGDYAIYIGMYHGVGKAKNPSGQFTFYPYLSAYHLDPEKNPEVSHNLYYNQTPGLYEKAFKSFINQVLSAEIIQRYFLLQPAQLFGLRITDRIRVADVLFTIKSLNKAYVLDGFKPVKAELLKLNPNASIKPQSE